MTPNARSQIHRAATYGSPGANHRSSSGRCSSGARSSNIARVFPDGDRCAREVAVAAIHLVKAFERGAVIERAPPPEGLDLSSRQRDAQNFRGSLHAEFGIVDRDVTHARFIAEARQPR